jgi:hypothetical protein
MSAVVSPLASVARLAHSLGISVIPPAEDGSKRPIGSWKQYQAERPTPEQVARWWGDHLGLGFICGEVSGNLELFEFDDTHTYLRFVERARECGLGDLVDRIQAGYYETTPGDGVHWFYRCEVIAGNTKLAERPGPPDEQGRTTVEVLIETRGRGGFSIVAPSGGPVHPSGRPYTLVSGGVESIVTITPEEREALWELARSFDEKAAAPADDRTWEGPAKPGSGWKVRPGDAFNRQATWEQVLPGWAKVYAHGEVTFWRRPGKAAGVSATTNYGGSDCFYPFTTSSEFPAGRSFTKFGTYALLEHHGDFKAATQALHDAGFGEKEPERAAGAKPNTKGTPAGAPWEPLTFFEPPRAAPAPVDVLPASLANYCRAVARATQTPYDFALASVLTVAGAAVGQSVNIRVTRQWSEPPLFYTILVAPPGRKKSPVIRAVRRPLLDLDIRLRRESKERREQWEEAKKQHAKDPENCPAPGPEPPQRRAIVDDVTRASLVIVLNDNPRGVLADPKEAAAWTNSFDEFNGGKGRDRQFWMCIYDAEPVQSDRKGGRESTFVPHPFCAVLASTQPGMLACLREEHGRSDGFLERLTLVSPAPESFPSQYWSEAEVPPELETAWRDCVQLLHATEMVPDEMREMSRPWYVTFTEGGKAAWVEWHDRHVREAEAEDFDPALSGAWSKMVGRCARLALILSRLRWCFIDPTLRPSTPLAITEADVEGAARVTSWLGSHLVRAAHEMAGGVTDADARSVLDWIRRHARTSFRLAEVAADLRRFRKDPKDLEQALKVLDRGGAVRLRAEEPGPPRAGRPASPTYDVHPELLKLPENAINPEKPPVAPGDSRDDRPGHPVSGINGISRQDPGSDAGPDEEDCTWME